MTPGVFAPVKCRVCKDRVCVPVRLSPFRRLVMAMIYSRCASSTSLQSTGPHRVINDLTLRVRSLQRIKVPLEDWVHNNNKQTKLKLDMEICCRAPQFPGTGRFVVVVPAQFIVFCLPQNNGTEKEQKKGGRNIGAYFDQRRTSLVFKFNVACLTSTETILTIREWGVQDGRQGLPSHSS